VGGDLSCRCPSVVQRGALMVGPSAAFSGCDTVQEHHNSNTSKTLLLPPSRDLLVARPNIYSSQSIADARFTFTFGFRAFGRRFYPKPLPKSTFVEGETAIYHCGT